MHLPMNFDGGQRDDTMENKTTGLVLEGGAMRGMFTAGVIDVLMENNITFPACVGVSAGAAFGCNIKSNQSGRVLRYNLKYCSEPKYCSVRSLIKTGDMFGAEFCYHTVPDELDVFDREAFQNNPMDFYVVCTDVETGMPYYKKLDKVDDACYDWIRASASMPVVSRAVELDGRRFLDGGVSDSIPLRFMQSKFERNIVVLTQPRGYVKKPASMLMFRRSLKKYPNMLKAVANRHKMYNEERQHLFKQEKAGKALVICPDAALEIGRIEHKPAMIQKTYDLGRAAAEQKLDDIKRYIENGN